MEEFSGKYIAQTISILGGFLWEVFGTFKGGAYSTEDLKSDMVGALGSLDYSSCDKPCEREKCKMNRQ